jgi:lipooligosaccharide transport system permease protein
MSAAGAAVEAHGLVKRYGALTAVRGIDFEVRPGECFGFLGPNGAGKTSTMKAIYGLAKVDGGELHVLGLDARTKRREIKARIGVVPQEQNLDGELSVRENLVMQATYHGIRADGRIDELLRAALLEKRADSKPQELSGGMKRRLLIARALVNDPEVVDDRARPAGAAGGLEPARGPQGPGRDADRDDALHGGGRPDLRSPRDHGPRRDRGGGDARRAARALRPAHPRGRVPGGGRTQPARMNEQLRAYLPTPRVAMRVWLRNVRVFSKVWKQGLLPQFFDPLFYLMAMGFGLGTYLARVNGIPYREFIAPGLVASSVMWAASFETTWNIYFKMEEKRLYDAILATPVEVPDLVAGEVAWAATRSVIYGTTFIVIVALFGLVASPWVLAVPPFLVLGGACFGMLGIGFSALAARVDLYSYYFTLFVTPMFLFSGIFYPFDKLPDWVGTVAWFTPLYHLVNITRSLILDPDLGTVLGNSLWLLVLTLVLFVVPVRWMQRRLVT